MSLIDMFYKVLDMIKCVIFDLDDTLYDEIEYCHSGFAVVARLISKEHPHLHWKNLYDAMAFHFTVDHTTVFNALCDDFKIPSSQNYIDTLITAYREHDPTITLPNDSREILDAFKDKYKLALLTDGFLPAQQLKVKALNIENYFDCIIYTELLGRENWKPSPLGYEKILHQLEVQADQCVYIADNCKKDFISPNKMGMHSVRLIRQNSIHNSPAANDTAAAKQTITSFSQLPPIIERL